MARAQIGLSTHTLCPLLIQVIKSSHHQQFGPGLADMGGAEYQIKQTFRSGMRVNETSAILKLMRVNGLDGAAKLAGPRFSFRP